MELRHLRYFIAVAETGSLTEAAELRLHTSQPSLSRQIRDLEHQVGVDLLSRSVRGVELTDAGKPSYAKGLLPRSVVSRPLEGNAPTIDVAVGYNRTNTSPILKLFLSRLEELTGHAQT